MPEQLDVGAGPLARLVVPHAQHAQRGAALADERHPQEGGDRPSATEGTAVQRGSAAASTTTSGASVTCPHRSSQGEGAGLRRGGCRQPAAAAPRRTTCRAAAGPGRRGGPAPGVASGDPNRVLHRALHGHRRRHLVTGHWVGLLGSWRTRGARPRHEPTEGGRDRLSVPQPARRRSPRCPSPSPATATSASPSRTSPGPVPSTSASSASRSPTRCPPAPTTRRGRRCRSSTTASSTPCPVAGCSACAPSRRRATASTRTGSGSTT